MFPKLWRTKYGKVWQHIDEGFYENIFNPKPLIIKDFIEFLNRYRNDIKTVLEIGCGEGIYPIKYRHLFDGMKYTGIDIGKPAIKHCRSHSDFEFIRGDVLKMESRTFDLVFSSSVIDHIYDIDGFLRKIVGLCNKHAYITAYRGYHEELQDHKMMWNDNEGCYYNDISVSKVKQVLMMSSCLSEHQFILRKQESGLALNNPLPAGLDEYELTIEIHK